MTLPEPSARTYARIRIRLLLAELILGLAFLAIVQGSGASRMLARWWSSHMASEPVRLLGYLTVLGAMSTVMLLPLAFYGGFLIERRFGLSRLTVVGWLARTGKRLAVSAVLWAILLEGLYALLRHAPRSWPLWATLGWIGFSVVLTWVFPTVLVPIFYATSPLRDEGLTKRLVALCRRVGLPVIGVFRFDLGVETRKANAALVGLGSTRRVLLSDTLIAGFTPEEVEGILAHELAHHRFHHLATLLLASTLGSLTAFTLTAMVAPQWMGALRLDGLADLAGVPALLLWLSVLGLMGLPIHNALSRRLERQADRFALEVAAHPAAFASALRRLAQLNLADPSPPRWLTLLFYDHPPIMERIHAAIMRAGARELVEAVF